MDDAKELYEKFIQYEAAKSNPNFMANAEYEKRVDNVLNKDPAFNSPGNTRKYDYFTQLNKRRNPNVFKDPLPK